MRLRAMPVIVFVTALGVALAGCSGSKRDAAPSPAGSAVTRSARAYGPGPQAAAPSWPAPADASAAVRAAGLPMLGEEKLAVHYHAHLDVIIDGQPVPVPAGLGIDEARHLIAPLHTHDPSGIVHIESATDVPFTLGQVFTEWGQPLGAGRIGSFTVPSGQEIRVYRNGQQVTGDPAKVVLKAHDEIVVWVGPAGERPTPPSAYPFPPGD